MADGIQGFVDAFFQAEGLRNQRRELQVLEDNAQAERIQLMSGLATLMVDPEARRSLAFIAGGDQELQDMVIPLLDKIAPGVGAMQRLAAFQGMQRQDQATREGQEDEAASIETTGMTMLEGFSQGLQQQLLSRGIQNASQDELADMARTAFARAGSGMTPGELAEDIVIADTPKDELAAKNRILSGQQLSEFEEEQVSQWAAEMGLNWARLEQDFAMGTAELETRMKVAELAALSSNGELPSPNTLVTTINQSLEALKDPNLTPEASLMHITVVNSAADNLSTLYGKPLFPPGVRLSTNPDDLNGGFLADMARGFQRFTRILFDQEPDMSSMTVPTDASELLDNQGNLRPEVLEMFREMGLAP